MKPPRLIASNAPPAAGAEFAEGIVFRTDPLEIKEQVPLALAGTRIPARLLRPFAGAPAKKPGEQLTDAAAGKDEVRRQKLGDWIPGVQSGPTIELALQCFLESDLSRGDRRLVPRRRRRTLAVADLR